MTLAFLNPSAPTNTSSGYNASYMLPPIQAFDLRELSWIPFLFFIITTRWVVSPGIGLRLIITFLSPFSIFPVSLTAFPVHARVFGLSLPAYYYLLLRVTCVLCLLLRRCVYSGEQPTWVL